MGLCGKVDIKKLINFEVYFEINLEPKSELEVHAHFQCCSCVLHAYSVVALLREYENE